MFEIWLRCGVGGSLEFLGIKLDFVERVGLNLGRFWGCLERVRLVYLELWNFVVGL